MKVVNIIVYKKCIYKNKKKAGHKSSSHGYKYPLLLPKRRHLCYISIVLVIVKVRCSSE